MCVSIAKHEENPESSNNKNILCSILILLLLLITQCENEEREEGMEKEGEEIKELPREEPQTVPKEMKREQYTLNEEGNYEFACQDRGRYNVIDETVHVVYSTVSEDSITWTKEQFIRQGSVPEVIYFDGKYYLFVMAECLMYVSEDGLTFEPYTYILKNENLPENFTGMRSFGVDPTALVDKGTIHLFFYEPEFQETPTDPAWIPGDHSIVQYVSEDAVTWQRIGEAIALERVTDPNIVYYNEKYFLYLSMGSNVIGSSSEEGEIFSVLNNGETLHSFGGVPDSIVIEGVQYMYAHKQEVGKTVIKILKSTDGVTWEEVVTALDNAEAPSVVQLPDGSYRMYYVVGMSEGEFENINKQENGS